MNIIVLDGYTLNPGDNPWDEVEKLGNLTVYERTDPEDILERSLEADIIVTNKSPLFAETLNRLARLKFISVMATGYNIVDTLTARERDIPVSNVPEYGTDSVAQFTFALLLELCHHVGVHSDSVKTGDWSQSKDWCFWKTPQVLLAGKRMGIVGFGRIGRRVGELAHAFGMEVMAYDVEQKDPPAYSPFCWKTREDLCAEADVISLHCALTDENARFVNQDLLRLMKKEAFLINAARGGLINEHDLGRALNDGMIAGAGLDVVSIEPIENANPLLSARNCIITPHIAWATTAARRKLMASTAENIKAFMAGKSINVVNGL
jgi:glycerate dehydrogenase